jgi:hypothetical protein
VTQPAPAPHFSRTEGSVQSGPAAPGEHSVEILKELGFSQADCDEFIRKGAVHQAPPDSQKPRPSSAARPLIFYREDAKMRKREMREAHKIYS